MKARFSKQTAINALPPMVRKACDEYIEAAWKARQKIIIRRWSLATCLALNDILHLGDKRLIWVLRGIGDILASYAEENFTSSESRNGSIRNGQRDPAAATMQAELLSRRKIHLYIDMNGVPGAVREEVKS